MASWAELERVRKDPVAFRDIAKRLIGDPYCEDSEFAEGFLENIANWKHDEITLRQAEVLLDLRDNAKIYTRYKGFSIQLLMEKCYTARDELDEADRGRLEALYKKGRSFVTGAQMGWFKGICKQLGEMEKYM